jgi:hypothetical protein
MFSRSLQKGGKHQLLDEDDRKFFVGNAHLALMSALPENLDVSFLLLAKKYEAGEVDPNRALLKNLNEKAHVDATIFKDYTPA